MMGKYARLAEFLREQRTDEVALTFDRIEKITGAKLPQSAKRYRAWWSNNARNSVMTRVWLAAGFRSERVNMEGRKLVFRRVRRGTAPGTNESQIGVPSRHPLFGCLRGTVRIAPGVDLTEPADPEWANSLDK
jgi:hypothetical protein